MLAATTNCCHNRQHHVSTDAFDAALKLQLLLKPLSYKVGDMIRV